MKILKNKKGFTLVELCVVIAITAIVGSMVMTFIMYSSRQQAQITSEASAISETTLISQTVNSWIKKYDSATYVISASAQKLVAKKAEDSSTASELYLSGSKMVEKTSSETPKTEALKSIKKVEFNRPSYTKNTKSVKEQVIRVTVTYNNKDKQTLLLPLFSNITRERKVEER